MGAPEHSDFDLKDYVLGHFSKEEAEILTKVAIRAVYAIEEIIKEGAKSAMNKYNGAVD